MIVKVFIACLGTETNTFSNLPTGWKTFEETMLFYGDATDNEPNTFSLPLHIWRKRSEERNYEVIESVAAFAQPGGKTLDSVYEELRDKVLSDLRSAGEIDIVLGGPTLLFDVERNIRIFDLKNLIRKKENIPIEEQILVFNKQVLENDKTIDEYSIKEYNKLNQLYYYK